MTNKGPKNSDPNVTTSVADKRGNVPVLLKKSTQRRAALDAKAKTGTSLSVIMPALNEENNIGAALSNTLKALDDFDIDGEVVVVNDGSNDKTSQLIRTAMQEDKRIRMIAHDTSKGIGASFWDGVDDARGEVVIMIPGDNENDPWEIFRYCDMLNHVDIVIPFIFNREARSVFRNALSLVYRFIINTTFLVNFNYTNGTVLYRRAVLKKLDSRSTGFFFQTDILIRLVKKHYLFAEVPYRLGSREHGVSRAVSFPSLWNVMKGYLRLVKDYYFAKEKKNMVLLSRESLTFIRRRRKQNSRNRDFKSENENLNS